MDIDGVGLLLLLLFICCSNLCNPIIRTVPWKNYDSVMMDGLHR